MIKTIVIASVLIGTPVTLNAMQCPLVKSGTTFQHPVVYNGPAQSWLMDVNYINQGWTIIQDPLNQNSPSTTVSGDAALRVTYVRSTQAFNVFTVACENTIDRGTNIILVLTNNYLFPASTSVNFKRLSDITYICDTSANNPSK